MEVAFKVDNVVPCDAVCVRHRDVGKHKCHARCFFLMLSSVGLDYVKLSFKY